MAQWGSVDRANSSPMFGPALVRATANTDNRDDLYGNTSSGAFLSGVTTGVFGVSPSELDEATANVGGLASVTVTNPGFGYTSVPARANVIFTGTGSGASANTITLKLVDFAIIEGGQDYEVADVLTINAAGATGSNTTIRFDVSAVDNAGAILAMTINNAGVVNALPTVIANNAVLGGNGTSAEVQLIFGINAITINAVGSGYTSATVTTVGAGGSGFVGAGVPKSSGAVSAHSAGWVLRKVLPNGRVQMETLVAMKTISSDGSDDTIFPE